jgi:hypothetical protein
MPVAAAVLVVLAACGGGAGDPAPDGPRITSGLKHTETTRRPEATTPVRLGTRTSPVPRGTEVAFDNGWKVTVLGTTPDATAAVAAENQFNDPPKPGEQFYLVKVGASYASQDSATPLGALAFSALEDGNTQIREGGCGVVPEPFDAFTEVFSGGSLTGNVCFAVPSATAGSLVMYVDAGLIDRQRAFFALS